MWRCPKCDTFNDGEYCDVCDIKNPFIEEPSSTIDKLRTRLIDKIRSSSHGLFAKSTIKKDKLWVISQEECIDTWYYFMISTILCIVGYILFNFFGLFCTVLMVFLFYKKHLLPNDYVDTLLFILYYLCIYIFSIFLSIFSLILIYCFISIVIDLNQDEGMVASFYVPIVVLILSLFCDYIKIIRKIISRIFDKDITFICYILLFIFYINCVEKVNNQSTLSYVGVWVVFGLFLHHYISDKIGNKLISMFIKNKLIYSDKIEFSIFRGGKFYE